MADQGGLQLIPQTKRTVDIRRPGENRILYIGGVVLFVFGAVGLFVFQYRNSIESRIEEINLQMTQLQSESQRLRSEKENIRTLAAQFSVASELVRNHPLWTKGLAHIESRVHPDVYLLTLSATNERKVIDLKGRARTFTTVARQIASFLKLEAVDDVVITRINTNTDGTVEFTMSLKFNEAKLIREVTPTPSPRTSPGASGESL